MDVDASVKLDAIEWHATSVEKATPGGEGRQRRGEHRGGRMAWWRRRMAGGGIERGGEGGWRSVERGGERRGGMVALEHAAAVQTRW